MEIKNRRFTKVQLFDLSKSTLKKSVDGLTGEEDGAFCEAFYRNASFDNYLKTGTITVWLGKNHVVDVNDNFWLVRDGVVSLLCESIDELLSVREYLNNIYKVTPVAVVLPTQPKKRKGFFTLLLNGDTGEFAPNGKNLVDYWPEAEYPTISFECLRRLYDVHGEFTVRDVAQWLGEGQLVVVDYLPDNRITMKSDDHKKVLQWLNKAPSDRGPMPIKPPAPGYSWTGNSKWHRPATVLFYDKELRCSFLIGMDEGAYFGVELGDNPESVNKAFISLTPECCRGVLGVERQGEWFVKPTKEPSVLDFIVEFDELEEESVALGRDHKESAYHWLKCFKGGITRDGKVVALNPVLTHENGDHEELDLNGWYEFHRNTARRSVSVQGVD